MRRPNVLWICTDQQRWDTLSFLGHAGARTPNIDALAARGTAFDRAYCQSPICTPSRASFLSGRYPIAHQNHRNGNIGFREDIPLVPKAFRDAGYETGLIGKFHLSRAKGMVEARPEHDGYSEFYWSHHPDADWDEGHDYQDWLVEKGVDAKSLHDPARVYGPGAAAEHHQTTWAGERARDFIRRHADTPWFLTINLFDPHPPFDPPASYLERFDRADMPPPIFRESDIAHQERFTGVDQQSKVAVDPRAGDPNSPGFRTAPARPDGANHDTPPEIYDGKYIRACYHAMIAMVDDMVGALVAELDETGQTRDTIVLFMSDHGEMLGDHGLIYKGARFYEGLTRVPMIFSWPGQFREGVVSEALVELIDIPETLLEAAGLPKMQGMQGKSLHPMLTGDVPADTHKPYVLCEYFDALGMPGGQQTRASMFFDGRYKLNVYHGLEDVGELFDLQTDPKEFDDLWSDPEHAAVKCDLMQRAFSAMMLVSGAGPERTAPY
ncbi:arylsulfatase A-like enzyme [Palleronia aestuarii]|uniref:Arylsulfatase A-like enzyme n=1 Tax=Palleronia aestuarii TaxID=568105 RepID=A0A2W7N0E8_9RHOB|nr:sulfatase-like hydrolase/transferase [Palleronia aestuarii]PZX13598.1 arylsulfatase A-like enzyme [Palleronia aestuarii]